MIKESITIDGVLAILNSAVAADRNAIEALINCRVSCNKTLADHPTIQVAAYPEQKNEYEIGILGVLNSLFGVSDESGFGIISAFYEPECIEHGIDRSNKCTGTDVAAGKISCSVCGVPLQLRLQCFVRTSKEYLDGSYKEIQKTEDT